MAFASKTRPAPSALQVEAQTKVTDTASNWTMLIHLGKTGVLSGATASMALAHNRAGADEGIRLEAARDTLIRDVVLKFRSCEQYSLHNRQCGTRIFLCTMFNTQKSK
ncbi:hypothetical protein [Burkholderia metallica]